MGDAQAVGRMGTIAELWRYPVKSMLGERVDSVELGPDGVVGDRAYGLFDTTSGHLLSAKAVPALFEARAATTVDGMVVVTLPDGGELAVDDPEASDVLSAWLGRPVEPRRSAASGDHPVEFELRFDPVDDSGDLFAWPARPGSFLDASPVHALTTASLAAMAAARAESVWDLRRFRPNLFIDTPGVTGFVEDGWVGHDLSLGSGGAAIHVDQQCVRCAMPVRAQGVLPAGSGDRPALDRDVGVFRSLTAEHDNSLGVYCTVTSRGLVVAGDEVHLSP